jgi:hypothetical protein
MLDSLDGDRRRKCRTSNIGIETNDESFSAPSIRKELLIVSSKKKRIRGTKQSKADDDESDTDDERNLTKKKKSPNSELLDDDGFLKHSDDEGEWSDVDDGTDFFSFWPQFCTGVTLPIPLISPIISDTLLDILQTFTKVARNQLA